MASASASGLTRVAVCCRVWQVVVGQRIGRCGRCGEQPQVIWKPLTW